MRYIIQIVLNNDTTSQIIFHLHFYIHTIHLSSARILKSERLNEEEKKERFRYLFG